MVTLYDVIVLPETPAAAVWILSVLLPLTKRPISWGTLPEGSVSVTEVMLGTLPAGTVPVKLLVCEPITVLPLMVSTVMKHVPLVPLGM